MGLIVRDGVDIEAFKSVVLSNKARINRCNLGPEILNLAIAGLNSLEIAEALKAEGRGGLQPVSPSTISRWLRATNLFRGRVRPGEKREETVKNVKGLLATYEGEIVAEVEKIGKKYLLEIPKVIRRARKVGFLSDMTWKEGRSDLRRGCSRRGSEN